MVKQVSLDDFADELRDLSKQGIKKFKFSVIDALYKNLYNLVAASPIDTGLYAQSWRVEETEKSALLGNIAPHAGIIEFGSRPYKPPLSPLLAWARRVLQESENTDKVWALAKYTQAKIEAEGQKPKFILTNQLQDIVADIKKNMKGMKLV